jgi:hypothetical protein
MTTSEMFLPFIMRTYAQVHVIWERRNNVLSQYVGVCAKCGKHYKGQESRTVFVLVPEGSTRRRNPFIIITSCPECAANVRQTLSELFTSVHKSDRIYQAYEVSTILRRARVKFVDLY